MIKNDEIDKPKQRKILRIITSKRLVVLVFVSHIENSPVSPEKYLPSRTYLPKYITTTLINRCLPFPRLIFSNFVLK